MKVIRRTETQKLVEFADGGVTQRSWVPIAARLTKKEARRGVAYGVTVEDVQELFEGISPRAVAACLLNGLHQRGVWTKQDIRQAGAANALQLSLWDAFGVRPHDIVQLFLTRG